MCVLACSHAGKCVCVCLLVLFLQTGDVASRYAQGHPVAAVAHLECVFASDDTALPHLQVNDLAVGVWVWQGPFICGLGGAYLCRFSSDPTLAESQSGGRGAWGWNPASFVAPMAPGMPLLLNSEN